MYKRQLSAFSYPYPRAGFPFFRSSTTTTSATAAVTTPAPTTFETVPTNYETPPTEIEEMEMYEEIEDVFELFTTTTPEEAEASALPRQEPDLTARSDFGLCLDQQVCFTHPDSGAVCLPLNATCNGLCLHGRTFCSFSGLCLEEGTSFNSQCRLSQKAKLLGAVTFIGIGLAIFSILFCAALALWRVIKARLAKKREREEKLAVNLGGYRVNGSMSSGIENEAYRY